MSFGRGFSTGVLFLQLAETLNSLSRSSSSTSTSHDTSNDTESELEVVQNPIKQPTEALSDDESEVSTASFEEVIVVSNESQSAENTSDDEEVIAVSNESQSDENTSDDEEVIAVSNESQSDETSSDESTGPRFKEWFLKQSPIFATATFAANTFYYIGTYEFIDSQVGTGFILSAPFMAALATIALPDHHARSSILSFSISAFETFGLLGLYKLGGAACTIPFSAATMSLFTAAVLAKALPPDLMTRCRAILFSPSVSPALNVNRLDEGQTLRQRNM